MRTSRATLALTTPFLAASTILAIACNGAGVNSATGSPTPTPAGSPTATNTPTGSPTATASPTPVGSCAVTCNSLFTCDTVSGYCKNLGVPQLSHVWTIVMENTNYADVTASAAPYFTGTLYPLGVQMTNYFAVTHPSLPNYIAMTGGDNFGITNDGVASSPTYQVVASHPNIASQMEAAGLTWHEYSESQTSSCQLSDSGSDTSNDHFVSKHNPMSHFMITQNSASCAANDVSFDANGSMPGLAGDIAAGTTFNYNFISPNLCDDGHDLCTNVASTKIGEQDQFLSNNISTILGSTAYQQGGLIIVTWDENDNTSGSGESQVATLFISPMLAHPGGSSGIKYTHYSALATIEAGFGLTNLPSANGHSDALITDIWK